jgi:hypothetical protein
MKKGDMDGDADDYMSKSFKLVVKNADGKEEEIEAVDGVGLFKSLAARVEKSEGAFAKAFAVIKSQDAMIKALQAKVDELGSKPAGRKAVLTITEKPAPKAEEIAKAQTTDGMTADQFFAKALHLQAEGKITGEDIARTEAYLNRGQPVPAEIVAKVLAHSK